MPISTPTRRCLLGLSLGAACAGAAAHPATALADYSLEQLSEIIVAPAPVPAGAVGGYALRAFPASGYPGQQADSAQCVQPRRLWSEPPARSAPLVPVTAAPSGVPERAH